jgi:HTH-type transcriptional regulator / antitoxin HigA
MERLRPARVVSPGTILRREIEARDWTQRDLAAIIGRPPQAISEIVRGAKQITPETALEFSEAFGTSPEFWMNLETNYRLRLAEKQREQRKKDGKDITRKSELYLRVPVSELMKLGWIKATDRIEELEREVFSFLGVSSLEGQPRLAVNFRHADFKEPEYFARLAWIRRVEQVANAQPVKAFDRDRLKRSLSALFDLSVDENNISEVHGILMDLGIHFVIVLRLDKTYIDGVMIPGANPIVGLTLRHNRLDNFWFTLAHELAHIVAGHNRVRVDEEGFEKENKDSVETEANELARNWLLNPKAYSDFIAACKGRYFSGDAIQSFAHSQSRHPSIVLGRLQFDNLVHWRNLRQFHVKVRDHLQDLIADL